MGGVQAFAYEDGDVALHGLVGLPEGPGPHPAVLVLHSALGIEEVERRRAEDLAALGYVALVADLYAAGARTLGEAEYAAAFTALQRDGRRLRERVRAAFDALKALPEVDGARIGAVGFCFGGQCALELARSGADVAAVVSLHGLLTTAEPARAGAVKAKVLVIAGALDPFAPAADVAGFQREMADAGADWQLTLYGQGWHAFSTPGVEDRVRAAGVRYDPLLDRLSWAQTTALLAETLRPAPRG